MQQTYGTTMNDLFNLEHRQLISGRGQCPRLYRYMLQGHKVTPLESWRKLGIYRLASRVFDLREMGIDVKDEWAEVINVYGELCKVKAYFIERSEI